MRRASAALVVACLAGCGGRGLGGVDPRAAVSAPRVLSSSAISGAAIGWSLGGEVHVFVVDDSFAQQAYARLSIARMLVRGSDVRAALDQTPSGLITIAGQQLEAPPQQRGIRTAWILSRGRLAAGELTLIRIHAGSACAQSRMVTELVYRLSFEQRRFAPPAQSPVVALFGSSSILAQDVSLPSPLPTDARVRLLGRVAARAAHMTSRASPERALAGALTVDPDRAADAGELLPTAGRDPELRYALAIRARFLESSGDTTLVTGVAVADSAGAQLRWVMRPVRFRLRVGLAESESGMAGVRYVLRGTALAPGDAGELLLIDEVNDASPAASRALAVDPWRRRVLAAQPLALRCR